MTGQEEAFSFWEEEFFGDLESVVEAFFSDSFEPEEDESEEVDSLPLSFFGEPARL